MWAADSRGVLLTCLLQACSLPGDGAGTGPTYLLVAIYTLLPYLLNYTWASDMTPRPGRVALLVCPQPPSQHRHHVPGGTTSDPGPQSALQSPGWTQEPQLVTPHEWGRAHITLSSSLLPASLAQEQPACLTRGEASAPTAWATLVLPCSSLPTVG